MHPGRAGRDHRLHQLERVQKAAEAGLGVGDDRLEPVDAGVALCEVDLIRSLERVVDALNECRDRVGGIKGLVGVGRAGQVCIGCHLPTGAVDGLQAGLYLLHRLVAGDRAEGADVRLFLHVLPQLLGPDLGQRVLDLHAAAQAEHVFRRVGPLDPFPARIVSPVLHQFIYGVRHHDHLALRVVMSLLGNGLLLVPAILPLVGVRAPTGCGLRVHIPTKSELMQRKGRNSSSVKIACASAAAAA